MQMTLQNNKMKIMQKNNQPEKDKLTKTYNKTKNKSPTNEKT